MLVLYLFKNGLDNTAKPGTENQLPERTRDEFSRLTSPVYSDVENLEKLTVNTTVCILNFIHAKTIYGPTNNEARREVYPRKTVIIYYTNMNLPSIFMASLYFFYLKHL